MKIAIIGAGGIGGFLGAMLARAGNDVSLLARGPHLAAIAQNGLQLESRQFGSFTVTTVATDDAAKLGRNELVFITVKMNDFEEAARTAKSVLSDDGFAVTIQNGLDAPDILARVVGEAHTLIGTIAIEASIEAPGKIAHTTPMHVLTLAQFSGTPSDAVKRLQTMLREAELNALLAEDGRKALWDKACILIPFATLTAAGDCTLGEIYGIPALKHDWTSLSAEAAAVARADGYDVTESLAAMLTRFESLAQSSPGFTTSMNRDIRAGRRSELEWLTGRLIQIGTDKGVATPAHATLYGLLKLKAQRASV
ncbi:MAG TPA: 2-dehydropantoate 2-reductase [Candidatus Baltobacteraceae bacterium]|jgi:2-dehydropantoate 2-reductase